ncbi:hypothetical protein FKM82_017713 [Ascaphus truei]
MSQVIPNHVIRVGQSVCMAPKEDGGVLRQATYPGSVSVTTKCSYFSSERCVGQVSQEVSGHTLARTGIYGGEMNPASNPVFRVVEKVAHRPRDNHQAVPGGTGVATYPTKGEPEQEACDPGNPMSPSLDISIDNLNKLILQLDPTFQPLPIKCNQVRRSSARDPSPSRPVATETTNPPAIRCVEVNPKRAVCQETMQRSSSPMQKHEGILVSRGAQRDNCSPNGSVVFCGTRADSSGRQSYHQRPSTGDGHQATESIPIPLQMSRQHDDYTLSTSLGSETVQCQRSSFRTSEVSGLSNSPGSDTSYILGSTHSLAHDDYDGQPFTPRSTFSPFGSLGSFSNLHSPGIMSPMTPKYYFDNNPDIFSSNTCQPKMPHQSKTDPRTPTLIKVHANSCPPSVSNSSMDIPILLVNGCLENGDSYPISSKSSLGGPLRRGSSSVNSATRFNKTFSDSSLSSISDSPIRDGQPSMKFVMDTSKYWFKPGITRDQAVDFLKEKEPGSFLIRDSTSFRGSFGLAMKVPAMPSKPGEVTNDLVRHFLIESSSKGVHLKGAAEEPYFGSLSALVYQHAITPLSLSCKLLITDKDQSDGDSSPDSPPGGAGSELKSSAGKLQVPLQRTVPS